MTWRKWLVRGLVFSVLGGALLTWLVYEAWTNPSAMRHQVLDKLRQRFVGATIRLDSAKLRLLGGIGVSELRMCRRAALDTTDFLYVPSAVFYHDKEQLLNGSLCLRKIELYRPSLRLTRERDGQINLKDILGPVNLSERVPTIIIHQGTILLEDQTVSASTPLLEITGVELTAVNDPSLSVVIEGTGQTDVAGPVHFHATWQRETGAVNASIELSQVPVGPSLVERLHTCCPELGAHLRQLRGTGKVTLQVGSQSHGPAPCSYDLAMELTNGEWTHAALPMPLEHLEGSLHCVDGRICTASLRARTGGTQVEGRLENFSLAGNTTQSWEERVEKLLVRIDHLVVTPELVHYLPREYREIESDYQPRGPVSLTYTFTRSPAGRWNKHLSFRPEGMTGEFYLFPYRLSQLQGSLEMDFPSTRDNFMRIDLGGRTEEVPVTIQGALQGEKGSCSVDLTIAANNVPLDEKLFRALPTSARELARTFLADPSRHMGLALRPLGQGDIRATIRRARGQRAFTNRYTVHFHDAAVRYDIFPYPLEQVRGTLDLLPDHWEFRNGYGTHKGGEIQVEARSFPLLPATSELGTVQVERRDLIKVSIRGRDILLDSDFEQALAPPGFPGRTALQATWHTLALQGRLSFAADVLDHPDHPQDIDVGVDIHNISMRPAFFPYTMNDVSGSVRYARNRVALANLRARHGSTQLAMEKGLIDLKQGGGFRAWFTQMRGIHLEPDQELMQALTPALRKGLRPLQLASALNVNTNLIFDTPSEPGRPLKVWWDGSAVLNNNRFQAGLPLTGVKGQVSCHGHHNGQQFEEVSGNILLDEATILGQPLQNIQARVEVLIDSPDVLRVRDLKANLFGGTVGGQARIQMTFPPRYEVLFEALGIRLEQFGKHNFKGDSELQGAVRAGLHLFGEGDDITGLHGNGLVEVPKGKMYRLPLLLDLVKAIGLRIPDGTAFEQARMVFGIEGPQMRVHQLDLYGNAISLRGQGTVQLDGSNIHLDFNADWARLGEIPGVSDLAQALSNQILKIKMRGKLGDVKFQKELIPNVVDPVKKALGGSP